MILDRIRFICAILRKLAGHRKLSLAGRFGSLFYSAIESREFKSDVSELVYE